MKKEINQWYIYTANAASTWQETPTPPPISTMQILSLIPGSHIIQDSVSAPVSYWLAVARLDTEIWKS